VVLARKLCADRQCSKQAGVKVQVKKGHRRARNGETKKTEAQRKGAKTRRHAPARKVQSRGCVNFRIFRRTRVQKPPHPGGKREGDKPRDLPIPRPWVLVLPGENRPGGEGKGGENTFRKRDFHSCLGNRPLKTEETWTESTQGNGLQKKKEGKSAS